MKTFLLSVVVVLLAVASQARAAERPNIVFILTDDQRWDALSIAGHPFLKTPNIDRLGREGAYFRNAFVTTPLCSPARAAFFTGTYAHRHGIKGNGQQYEQPSHQLDTYHVHLQKSGYETAAVGKWHMGADASPRPGFDRWAVFKGQGRYEDCPFNVDGTQTATSGYVTDVITDFAVDFIKKDRPKDKPFSLYVGHKAVHGPFTPAERHKELFSDEKLPSRPNTEIDVTKVKSGIRHNANRPRQGGAPRGVGEQLVRNQLRALVAVDESVGRILKALEESGQLDNTFIVFASDNGYFWNEHKMGDKRAAYEEAIRIPLLARYPKLIKPGTRIEQMTLDVDLAPTLLELAAVKSKPATLHGISWLSLFKGDAGAWRTSAMMEYFLEPNFAHVPTWHAVRTENWKYIHYDDVEGVDELYDLQNDPYEMKNVIDEAASAQQLEAMKVELTRLLAEAN